MDDDKPHFPPDDLKVDFGRIYKEATDPKRLAEFRRQEDERHEREKREREAQARIVAIEEFKKRPLATTVYECPTCAALVSLYGRNQHLDWHGSLAETAAAAHEAAWRGRPIG